MFYVYILRCFDNSYYIGQTDDLITRIAQHNSGEIAGYTAERFPVTVLFSRAFELRNEAVLFEKQIKGWSRKKKEALIAGDFESLKSLSKKKNFDQLSA
jgi:predicted GIY-YIG superfamily endonuclease